MLILRPVLGAESHAKVEVHASCKHKLGSDIAALKCIVMAGRGAHERGKREGYYNISMVTPRVHIHVNGCTPKL